MQGRLELSAGGLFRKPVAGIDVRGDGTFVPYRAGVGAKSSTRADHDTPFDLVRETLEGDER